jgi:MscS family membrane protein
MNEANVTKKTVEKIAHEQDLLYTQVAESILQNRSILRSGERRYDRDIFTLKKVIKHNERFGHKYAVIRDEVKIKSYKVIEAQHRMLRSIFHALDRYDKKQFQTKMYALFAENQKEIEALDSSEYQAILKLKEPGRRLRQAKKNIKEFYALIDINSDVLRHIVDSEKKLFRLNKYAKYNLLPLVYYVEHLEIARKINPLLKPYGLDIVKLLLMASIFFLIYSVRKILYETIKALLLRSQHFKDYTIEILDAIRKPFSAIIILLGLELLIYIYNDFSSFLVLNRVFSVLYTLFFTVVVYNILNTIATIKLENIGVSDKKIKDELVNVGIKIINFLTIVAGLLLMLYFAGANLTAILSGLGIGGFAVAFAAKDSLANFLGTISILMSDVYSQGDWIVADGKQGIVVEIGLRVTTIRTFSNALIAIPNATLANSDVQNWSRRIIGRRIKMTIGVKYNSKVKHLRAAVEEIRQMLKEHEDIATERTSYEYRSRKSPKLVSKEDELGVKRTLLVYLDEFSDSSINILVYCFSKTTDWNEWLKIKEDVMYQIMDILEKNSLEFAFPSLSLYQEKEEDPSPNCP